MQSLANVFKALSDETRLQILALILNLEEACVCDVMQVCGITQSKASRHLRYLLHAGFLQDRREGTWIYYSIRPTPPPPTAAVLAANRELLTSLWTDGLKKRLEEWNFRKQKENSCSNTPVENKCGKRS